MYVPWGTKCLLSCASPGKQSKALVTFQEYFQFPWVSSQLYGITERILDDNAVLCGISEATVFGGRGTESLR